MQEDTFLDESWDALPAGARAALEEQWLGVAAGGLPCGSAIVDASGAVIASGRNHAYGSAGSLESRLQYPLQHNRLAHAELNALAIVPTEQDHASLTLWSTQHPCPMCAAAIAFTGIGEVRYVADDPSDHSSRAAIVASRGGVPYRPVGDPFWWTVSNLLFLYTSAVTDGERARNVAENRAKYPALTGLTLELAGIDAFGEAARSGALLHPALAPYQAELTTIARQNP